jgi:two-component system phosphate regulon response regulator PhoB
METPPSRKKIFIVEDDTYVQEILGCLLSRDYDLTMLDDGFKALEALEHEVPDLIFLDYMMPKVNGIDLCRELRRQERTRQTPIIMMSASADYTRQQVAGLQVAQVLSKPFDMTEILNQVETILGTRE